uniref:Uncharacterized protein AlNc14C48G3819 n=1 Tax=Albugo laibachii Nc14 TaxID=890382 RepID=F0WAV7_9STRA|nr:conserved hypothetical protein [Albugo laibachii Nc14]CCA18447.1 conserved hypothetical protein [Albugo laibachii Nc14]|eukprot:CCA18447.1 conserved hypothetical protein [Albugo laibachii Nc14]
MSKRVDVETAKYHVLQEELQVLVAQQQKYRQQANENNMVKQELDLVHDETKVYKMVGPVLLKQDLEEAKTNVNKRIEFIKHELYKVTKKIEDKENEAIEVRKEIATIQMEMQKQAAEASRNAIAAN